MYAEHTNVSRRAFLATAGGAAVGFEIARLPSNVAQAADVRCRRCRGRIRRAA